MLQCIGEENMLLEFTQHLKSIKTPFLIYGDFICLNKKLAEAKIIQKNHWKQK